MAGGAWQQELASLQEAGFTSDEIAGEQARQRQEMSDSGFSGQEIDSYFGVKVPNMGPTKAHIEEGFRVAREAAAPTDGSLPSTAGAAPAQPLSDLPGQAPVAPKPGEKEPHAAQTFLESLEAGFQMSVSGLLLHGQKPDVLMPEDAPMFYRIASQAATLAGDLPAMMAGAAEGVLTGGAVAGPVGAAIGAGAYGAALPAGLRRVLMDHYEKGDVSGFQDFWERAAATFIDMGKEAIVGGAAMGVGNKVAAVAAPAVKTVAQLSSEVATMVTVGKALDGEVPKIQDFADAAVMIGGLHGATALAGKASESVAGKLREIYATTGVKPSQVAEQAAKDVVVRQELLASNRDIPEAFKPMQDGAPASKPETVEVKGEDGAGIRVEKAPEAPAVERAPPAEDAAPVDKARAAILDRVGEEKSSLKDKIPTFNEIYEKGVDELSPLNTFVKDLSQGKEVPTIEDPYKLARLTRDTEGKATHFVKFGTLDYETGKVNGPSLREIMGKFEKDQEGVKAFLIANRAVELEGRGIKSGIPLEEAKLVVKDGEKTYGEAAKQLVEFQNKALAYLRDSGRISREAYANMADANQAYVPFYRLSEEGRVGGKASTTGSAIKKIKGSDAKILDPVESVVKNVMEYVRMAEENRALNALVDMAENAGELGKQYLEPVPRELRPIDVKSSEVAKFMKEHGIEGAASDFTIFRPEQLRLAKDEIAVFRDGKPQVYRVPEAVARAVGAMQGDRVAANLLFKLMGVPVKMLKTALSTTPDFISRNFIRDQIMASTTSKAGMVPFVDSLAAMKNLFKEDAVYQNWLKSGGTNAAFASIDKNYLATNVWKLAKETGWWDNVHNLVRHPIQSVKVAAELIENSTRLAEFKRVTGEAPDLAKIAEGGFASREVTVDFQRIGASVRAMNMITAFWNVQVQGLDRAGRAFAENPSGFTAKAAAAITMPSVLLWYANHDDPRWKEIPRWEKDLFWIVMTKDNVYRVPKPFEVGVLFGSLPERALEAFLTDNPKAFKDFAATITGGIMPGFVPTAATPLLETFANRSTFTGAPIIPRSLEGLLPEYQYTEYTTEAAKTLGKIVSTIPGVGSTKAASPLVIENTVRAWGGNLGMYALKVADELLSKTGEKPDPVAPARTLADIPFVKAFVIRHPSAQAQSIQDFYDRHSDNKQVVDTIRHLALTGDYDSMRKELSLRENQEKLVTLDGIKDALTNQSKFVRLVVKNPKMTADEKRRQIDSIYNAMIQEARMGNKLFDEIEKGFRARAPLR